MKDPFPTTAWSELVSLRRQGTAGARLALSHLYEAYWTPLYAFLRRRGLDADAAHDLLQSFYVHLLERGVLDQLDRSKGRLRAYLLSSIKNFHSDHRAREAARVRNPGTPVLSLDLVEEERYFRGVAASDRDPESAFELRWAAAVAGRAASQLARQEQASGNAISFDQLKGHVLGGVNVSPYREVAASLGISESAVKVRVHRYRKRLGEILRQELHRTVSEADDVDDELRHLLRCLSTSSDHVAASPD